MPKKIGIFLGARPFDGGLFQYSQCILEAAAALPSDRYEVVVAYMFENWRPALEALGVSFFRVSRGLGGRVASALWRKARLPNAPWRGASPFLHGLSRSILEQRCDLWIFPAQDAWSYQVPVPALATVHDLMHRYERRFPEVSAGGEFARREYHFANLCRWSKGVITDSELGRLHVHESFGVPIDRTFSLPYIAPKHVHSVTAPEDFQVRYRLPPKYIFYPAQFWEHKNHKRLVKALHLLRDRHPDLQLVLAGSKKNGYASTLALVRDLGLAGRVHFLGYVPENDLPELYRRARALVMPTFFGPTNLPPLEAFSLGCPVAISGIYAMPEQAAGAALLFDPASESDIAGTVSRLWLDDNLCSLLAQKGRERVRAWSQPGFSYRFESILSQTLAI